MTMTNSVPPKWAERESLPSRETIASARYHAICRLVCKIVKDVPARGYDRDRALVENGFYELVLIQRKYDVVVVREIADGGRSGIMCPQDAGESEQESRSRGGSLHCRAYYVLLVWPIQASLI